MLRPTGSSSKIDLPAVHSQRLDLRGAKGARAGSSLRYAPIGQGTTWNTWPMYFTSISAARSPAYNRSTSKILKRIPMNSSASSLLLQKSPRRVEADFAVREWIASNHFTNGRDLDSEFLWPFHEAVEKFGMP